MRGEHPASWKIWFFARCGTSQRMRIEGAANDPRLMPLAAEDQALDLAGEPNPRLE